MDERWNESGGGGGEDDDDGCTQWGTTKVHLVSQCWLFNDSGISEKGVFVLNTFLPSISELADISLSLSLSL